MGKVSKRLSHPLRAAAVRLLMRGEATPAEIRETLQVSRQLVYYWCRAAGIAGKTVQARKTYLLRALLKGIDDARQPEVKALRYRLRNPRPTDAQLRAAHLAKVNCDANP
jgi:transposase-like protein